MRNDLQTVDLAHIYILYIYQPAGGYILYTTVAGLKKKGSDSYIRNPDHLKSMGDLQDPKLEVRKRTIFLAIFCGDIPLRRPQK